LQIVREGVSIIHIRAHRGRENTFVGVEDRFYSYLLLSLLAEPREEKEGKEPRGAYIENA